MPARESNSLAKHLFWILPSGILALGLILVLGAKVWMLTRKPSESPPQQIDLVARVPKKGIEPAAPDRPEPSESAPEPAEETKPILGTTESGIKLIDASNTDIEPEAKEAAVCDGAVVTMSGISWERIVFLQPGGRIDSSMEKLLECRLVVNNTSDVKKITFVGWSDRRSPAVLLDNLGNRYKQITFGLASTVPGQASENESIYPSKFASDVLIFEAPVDAAESLTLQLPTTNFGGKHTIRFKFSRDFIKLPEKKPR
jgi:hypothetical protein